jgi:hypothetical protein
MRMRICILTAALAAMSIWTGCGRNARPGSYEKEVGRILMAREEAVLDRWDNGDPTGFVANADESISYFDPSLEYRLDGLQAFSDYLSPLKGKIHNPPRKIVSPEVRVFGETALVTYTDEYAFDGRRSLWHVTEVYGRMKNGNWKLIHSHWSESKIR